MDSTLKEQLIRIGTATTCPSAYIVREGKVLKGLRHYTPDKWKEVSAWISPGGRCEEGETVEACLRREVREEVGITDLQILEFIGEIDGAKAGDVVPVFLCATAQDFRLMEPEKFSEWRWVPLAEYAAGEPWSTMNPQGHRLVVEFLKRKQLI